MHDTEYCNLNGGMKKQLRDITLQVYKVNEKLARQNNAINTSMKLQYDQYYLRFWRHKKTG
ncbi:hypothetical protein [Nitrososphaera sp. AFS]|uniref:hypothetical protein n=1 Tax=Nitrososphaera sp. AFS TaxID=2301191 RepID=UPI0013922B54|nr:hypothetical protein [Nitrososphaera sp. AFS]